MQTFTFHQKELKKRLQKISLKTLPLIIIFLFAGEKIFAQNVTIFINPALTTVNQGQSFTVNVSVDITSGSLNAIETFINFDRSLLQVTNITKPSAAIFTSETTPLPSDYTAMNGTGAGSGQINYGAGMPSGSTSTDFDILQITFLATQQGTASLVFNTTSPRITRAVLGFTVVSGPPVNGSVTINPLSCTPPTATIANTGTCNGQPFDLVLQSATGATAWDLEIDGNTYNNIPVGGTITTITPPTENIWGTGNPGASTGVDGSSISSGGLEVGIKFQSDVNGLVKGIRFFRPVTGVTFTGRLYESDGTLLASVTLPSSAPTDQWQQVLFSSAVPITANTTYLVTYHSAAGYYKYTDNYLTGSVTNGHLTALADGADGSNGLYEYESGGTYPTQTFASANYWVDPVFSPNEFTFELTSVTDNDGCSNVGAPLQTLNVTSTPCSSLPVSLLNLSATPQGNNVILNWSTATEINNKGFELQRSVDNILWEGITFVSGAGNSSSLRSYSYTDKNLFPRRYYYRLKQVDIDDNYKYSIIVAATLNGKAEYALQQNYPNPFRGETTIQYTLPQTEKVMLTLFDMNGKAVKTIVNETRQAGTHAAIFYTNSLPSGLYYYKLEAGHFSAVRKMIIQ